MSIQYNYISFVGWSVSLSTKDMYIRTTEAQLSKSLKIQNVPPIPDNSTPATIRNGFFIKF